AHVVQNKFVANSLAGLGHCVDEFRHGSKSSGLPPICHIWSEPRRRLQGPLSRAGAPVGDCQRESPTKHFPLASTGRTVMETLPSRICPMTQSFPDFAAA